MGVTFVNPAVVLTTVIKGVVDIAFISLNFFIIEEISTVHELVPSIALAVKVPIVLPICSPRVFPLSWVYFCVHLVWKASIDHERKVPFIIFAISVVTPKALRIFWGKTIYWVALSNVAALLKFSWTPFFQLTIKVTTRLHILPARRFYRIRCIAALLHAAINRRIKGWFIPHVLPESSSRDERDNKTLHCFSFKKVENKNDNQT